MGSSVAWPPYPDNPVHLVICTCCQASSRCPPSAANSDEPSEQYVVQRLEQEKAMVEPSSDAALCSQLLSCQCCISEGPSILLGLTVFFCSGASVSPNIYDRDMQNSHFFWAFFPKIYHTDGVLVLSLALVLILQHAYSSMVHSRSPWSTGVPPCYQPLLPRPCKLL